MMETPQPRSGPRHLHGQGRPMPWRTISAAILLALGILVKTASGDAQELYSLRVVGGQDARLGDWPWQASVLYNHGSVCGGALISRDWVVTAAHCVIGKNYRKFQILLGVLNLTDPSPTKLLVAVNKILMYPKYGRPGSSGDLALLRMENPVTFNKNIRPIRLASQDQNFQNGKMCKLTGWGRTDEQVLLKAPFTLQEVSLPLINHTNCDKMFQAIYNYTFALEYVKKDMICAGYPEGKKDGCQGDSGGPLVCKSGNIWYLVGIMSWGSGCARPLRPGVYTKVSSFHPWILEKTNITVDPELEINATTVKMETLTTQRSKEETTVGIKTVTTQRPKEERTIEMEKPTSRRPKEGLTTRKIAAPITQGPNQGTAVEMKTPTTWRPKTEMKTSITQRPKAVSQTYTSADEVDQGTTSTGRTLPTPINLVVVVIALTRILDVV